MKIGDIELKNSLLLAPMAGYTDIAFRYLCKKCGAGLTCTEMVSSKGLLYDSEKTKSLLYKSEAEDVSAVQIFGSDPSVMADVCQHELLKDFDIIDINMGCPAPKIIKNGDGSALLKDIKKAEKIISSCAKATKKPITVKFRIGFDENHIVTTDFAKMCESAGAKMITIHGRTTNQGYSGTVNYEEIKKAKQAVKIPVVANGDVVDKTSYENALNLTGADGVMIGRGAMGNPFIFCELLNQEPPFSRFQALETHYNMLLQYYNPKLVLMNMRKHLAQYLKGGVVSMEEKRELLLKEDINEILDFCKQRLN